MGYKADFIVSSINRGDDAVFVMRQAGDVIDGLVKLKKEVAKAEYGSAKFQTEFEEHVDVIIADLATIAYHAHYDAMMEFDKAAETAKHLEE